MLAGPISEIVPLFSHAEALSRYGTTVCMQAIISVDRICVEAWGSGVRVRFFALLRCLRYRSSACADYGFCRRFSPV